MSTFTEANSWVNLGDMDPIEHGGIFVRKDKDFPKACDVIMVNFLDAAEKFFVDEGYVDTEDDWIEWEDIINYTGYTPETVEEKAMEVVQFYGSYQTGGRVVELESKKEVVEYLASYGIVVKLDEED